MLHSVRDPACVLGLWQRELAGSIVNRLEGLSFSDLPVFESVGNAQSVRPQAHRAIQHAGWAGTAAGRWLESDIAGLSCRYAAVTGMRAMHVRLAAIDGDACRSFHVDRLSFRLLCTYRGKGTQWVSPGSPVEAGRRPDVTASLEAAPDRINSMQTHSVAILRGREPDTEQQGCCTVPRRSADWGVGGPVGADDQRRRIIRLTVRSVSSGQRPSSRTAGRCALLARFERRTRPCRCPEPRDLGGHCR